LLKQGAQTALAIQKKKNGNQDDDVTKGLEKVLGILGNNEWSTEQLGEALESANLPDHIKETVMAPYMNYVGSTKAKEDVQTWGKEAQQQLLVGNLDNAIDGRLAEMKKENKTDSEMKADPQMTALKDAKVAANSPNWTPIDVDTKLGSLNNVNPDLYGKLMAPLGGRAQATR
jgi:hypothetical protein